MADLSLDEIIAKKKGLKMFRVQFTNRNGKPTQRSVPRLGQQDTFQQKRPLSIQTAASSFSMQRGNSVRTNGSSLTGPGKGQIDARDMITIKNRIKLPDARAKIVQKRIGQRTFDARSKLRARNSRQDVMRPQPGLQPLLVIPQQQSGFQNRPLPIGSSSQQRFQLTSPSFSQMSGSLQISVNPVVPSSSSSSSRPIEPLTRTLQNPLANGGAVVENTGSSLKITRTISDVTFDGHNLTVTRRLPQSSKKQGSASGSAPPHPRMDSDRGPVIQIQNDKFRPTPVQTPSSSSSARSRQAPSQGGQRRRAPSPIQSPNSSSKRVPTKASRAEDSGIIKISSGYPADPHYKTSKNTTVFTSTSKTQEPEPQREDRLRPPPDAAVSISQPKRALGISSSKHPTHGAPTSTKPSKLGQHVSKRLAPRPSSQSPSAGEQRSTGSTKASKRRAPMSLSDRFAARDSGSSSPVIVDLVPAKKRRLPEPEPEKEEFEEDSEAKEQSEEEEEPETALISPLQGFRMLVSNLHASVTQDDIIELFGAIGPLKRANMLNKGQAEVAFIHRHDAVTALKKYHNRELDGQPMFVKVTTPLNAKVMKPPSSEESTPGLPPSLRSSKKAPASSTPSAPVEIPLIHKALFKTGVDSVPSKSVRFTVKL
ncbi:uncharacterized protein LOC143282201 [Babylonia areolata]|uniref:uncharacterized protein LOC143282201 n=1 Tax=Babylonia areolata TaxID=304850 RepID=UPI003FD10D9C